MVIFIAAVGSNNHIVVCAYIVDQRVHDVEEVEIIAAAVVRLNPGFRYRFYPPLGFTLNL